MNENAFYKLPNKQIDAYINRDVFVLGIETSCDETAVAIVKNGREVVVNLVASQIDIHKRFGGVVPEVASRNHLMTINTLINEAEELFKKYLTEHKVCNVKNESELKNGHGSGLNKNLDFSAFKKLDAIAVTYGAGLVGALMVGLNAAKVLSLALDIPLIGVNHIYGHIAACYLENKENTLQEVKSKHEDRLVPPFTALVVSGGHTELDEVKTYTDIRCIRATADDAIGECFDKVARVLNLPYPGGVEIEKLASKFETENTIADDKQKGISKNNNTDCVSPILLNYKIDKNAKHFSYSGLKSAVINFVHSKEQKKEEFDRANLAYTFQTLAFTQLVEPAVETAKKMKNKILILAGGVSANKCLRKMLAKQCREAGVRFFCPEFKYTTDNASMIASQGYFNLINNNNIAKLTLDADSSL